MHKCLEYKLKLEDMTVLKRSPDLLNNVKIGQDQLRLIMKHILFMEVAVILIIRSLHMKFESKWPSGF